MALQIGGTTPNCAAVGMSRPKSGTAEQALSPVERLQQSRFPAHDSTDHPGRSSEGGLRPGAGRKVGCIGGQGRQAGGRERCVGNSRFPIFVETQIVADARRGVARRQGTPAGYRRHRLALGMDGSRGAVGTSRVNFLLRCARMNLDSRGEVLRDGFARRREMRMH